MGLTEGIVVTVVDSSGLEEDDTLEETDVVDEYDESDVPDGAKLSEANTV